MPCTREDVIRLLSTDEEPCLSLYMPTYSAGREQRQNLTRFHNLLRDAEELLSHEADAAAAGILLGQLQHLGEDERHVIWQHPRQGLAVFATPKTLAVYQFGRELPEQVHVGERFYLRPLLPLLQTDGQYLVLAVSQNCVRLFEGSRSALHEVPVPSLPDDLQDALQIDEYQSSLQYYSFKRGGDGEAVFHGHGAGDDDHKQELLKYFHRLDEPLSRYLAARHEPLLFAGVKYLFPIFQEAVHYPNLLDTPVTGNLDDAPAERIHDQAWPLMEKYFRSQTEARVASFHDSYGTNRACDNLDDVMVAASRGAIDALLIRAGAQCWGQVDGQNNVRREDDPSETSLDLLDEAAYETLRHGGAVTVVEPDLFPADDEPCVAILRYPLRAAVAK